MCFGLMHWIAPSEKGTAHSTVEKRPRLNKMGLNTQRNNLAHGRKGLSAGEIRDMVFQSLQLEAWPTISQTAGELRLADWIPRVAVPWVAVPSATTGQTGLFERWQKNEIRYLIPETGVVFKVPRKSAAATSVC